MYAIRKRHSAQLKHQHFALAPSAPDPTLVRGVGSPASLSAPASMPPPVSLYHILSFYIISLSPRPTEDLHPSSFDCPPCRAIAATATIPPTTTL